MQIQKRKKNKKYRISPLAPRGNGIKLWCERCDGSTLHFPIARYMKQVNNQDVPSEYPTSKRSILLKCNGCGRLEKNIKRLAYGLNHYGGIK